MHRPRWSPTYYMVPTNKLPPPFPKEELKRDPPPKSFPKPPPSPPKPPPKPPNPPRPVSPFEKNGSLSNLSGGILFKFKVMGEKYNVNSDIVKLK